jgi:hypothetical protein
VRPFGFSDRTFGDYMIDLSIVVSPSPFVIEVGVGTSSDGENCTMSGKVVGLLRRLMHLSWRWFLACFVGLCCLALDR